MPYARQGVKGLDDGDDDALSCFDTVMNAAFESTS
jgi:hypothetical protein